MPNESISVADALAHVRSDREWTGNESEIVFSAATLMNHCDKESRITISDMLRLLDIPGTVAEFGARCLFVRTGRNNVGWTTKFGPDGFIVDKQNWIDWLNENGFDQTAPNKSAMDKPDPASS